MTNPVWPFTKQAPKYGYINNPNQIETAEFSNKHHPCGYWPVGAELSTPTKPTGGMLFTTGEGSDYRLGIDGTDTNRVLFTQINNGLFYKKIAAGNNYTLAITHDGDLWGIGGMLGLGMGEFSSGSTAATNVWLQIPGKWKDIKACGWYKSSLALKEDGTLWGTGDNSRGQLGLGDTTKRDYWVQIGSSNDWSEIDMVDGCTTALNSSNEFYTCGNNYYGRLGTGDTNNRDILVGIMNNVVSIHSGRYTAVTKSDNSVWMAGINNHGNFGNGNTTSSSSFIEITAVGKDNAFIECGYYTTFLVKDNGLMWTAGDNTYNQMGLADTSQKLNYVQLDGTDWGSVESRAWTDTLAVKANGEMHGTGMNANGELGFGDTVRRRAFERVGSELWLNVEMGSGHSAAINWDGTYDWG